MRSELLSASNDTIDPPPAPIETTSIFGCDVVIAIDHRLARILDFTVLNDGDLEGGAAHVGRDHVGLVQQLTERAAADHAGGRTAFEHADGTLGRFFEPAARPP